MLPACAGPAAERDAPRQRQAPSAATADSALLAQVGDMRITASDLQALQPSAAAMPVRQLLRRLEDFALLVQAAKAGGYATDPRVRWAHKQALAQQLLRAQVEQGRDPQVQPQAAAVRLRRLLWRARQSHPVQRFEAGWQVVQAWDVQAIPAASDTGSRPRR